MLNKTNDNGNIKTQTLNDGEKPLLTLNGVYNHVIYDKLDIQIKKIAHRFHATNPTIDYEDLYQEAWLRIVTIIQQGLMKNKEYNLKYLVKTAHNAILAYCQKIGKYDTYIDEYVTEIFNDYEQQKTSGLNDRKHKIDFKISKEHNNIVSLNNFSRLQLEEILLTEPINTLAKQFIMLRYIKDANGESIPIKKLYNNFYISLDSDRRNLLDNISDKMTSNEIFRILGIRATDNCTTTIRKEIKNLLTPLL